MTQPEQDSTNKKRNTPIEYPLLGVSMPLCVLIGFLVGRFLDQRLHSAPVFLLLFIVLGIAAGYMQLFKLIKRK